MGLFDRFKKTQQHHAAGTVNIMYELLFGDNTALYQMNQSQNGEYPWNILFAEKKIADELQKIIDDDQLETRIKMLAYSQLRSAGIAIDKKELLAVIVEVGLEQGNDVLASFKDGRARYINQSGRIIIWEAPDNISDKLVKKLFEQSMEIVSKIGPWDKQRLSPPRQGNARISFILSDGLYFGEGAINTLFNDPLAAPALQTATELMQFLISKDTAVKAS